MDAGLVGEERRRCTNPLAIKLLKESARIESTMDALVIAGTLLGSAAAAFALQKAALESLFRIMDADRRARR